MQPINNIDSIHSFDLWFGRVANTLTILAAFIAIAGVIWAIRSRARLSVLTTSWEMLTPQITFRIASVGSNPLRDIEVIGGQLTRDSFSTRGDGIARRAELARADVLVIDVTDPTETHHSSPPRNNEFRWDIRPDEGFYIQVTWRSPLFSWRRSSRTYVWSWLDRYGGQEPHVLKGRSEIDFLTNTRDPKNDALSDVFSPTKKVEAHPATDETFDDLLAAYRGITLVGFGPSWQGEHWMNVQRALTAYAAHHQGQVQVLTVTTDQTPRLSSEYDTNIVPTFKAFRDGVVVRTLDGLRSYKDLETTFTPLIRANNRRCPKLIRRSR